MGDVVAFESITLDGVMQAPGRPDEDPRGGFEHGGWAAPYMDPVLGDLAAEGMGTTEAMVFGRRTYQDFESFWPHQPEPNPFTEVLNTTMKYVASTTLTEPLPWMNSTLLKGDAADAVAALKGQSDKDLVILGSGELVRSLLARDVVDRFILLIHPLILGSGQRLFAEDGARVDLELLETRSSTTGVMVATYAVTSRG